MSYLYKKGSLFLSLLLFCVAAFAQTTARQWVEKADKLFKDSNYKDAVLAYEKAARLDPTNQLAFYMAGWCYNDLEKYSNAIEKLKVAVSLKKNDHLAWQELAYAYKKSKQYEEALSCINKAIAIKPDYALAYKQLGDIYDKQDKPEQAISAYKNCYRYDDQNDDACYNLGYLYNGREAYTDALEWLTKAKNIKPGVDVYNEIGFANYKLKRNEDALNAYQSALKINQANGTAYKGIGDTYRMNYDLAKVDDAISSYLKAIEYNPKNSGSHYGLGWCYNEKGKYEEAIPMLVKSIELDRTFAASYVELGYAQYMTKKYAAGLNTLKAGLAQNDKSSLCRYYSGLIYIAQADKNSATDIYNELKPMDDKLAEKLLTKINAMK